MSTDPALETHLRHALQHLYDPVELARNPLTGLLGGPAAGAVLALRRLLTDAIEALKPDPGLSPESVAWRTYQVLSYRFVKQFSQNSVALTLNLSVRQMRRQEALALQELAHYIAAHYVTSRPAEPAAGPAAARAASPPPADPAPPRPWPGDALPDEPAGLADVLASVLETALPLAARQQVALAFPPTAALPGIMVNRVALRQCLLNILAALMPAAAGGALDVAVAGCDGAVLFEVAATLAWGRSAAKPAGEPALLDMAARLAAAAGGRVTVLAAESAGRPVVHLQLPAAGQAPILLIDDNADAIQLLQRFLACSRYHLVAAQNPQEALDLAAATAPHVILLDVMMPEIDGWELLGRLRTHPLTSHIPVVLCSVLPQEQLALALGATAFLNKPLMPEQVLATLDRLAR